MSELSAKVHRLRRHITDEVIKALGMTPSRWTRAVLGPLVYTPAHRFSQIAAEFDERIAAVGLIEAARWALGQFRTRVDVSYQGSVPKEGPLLITSNHPGTVDSLAIVASVERPDLRIVASAMPFVRSLPLTARHLIYATRDTHDRMGAVRSMIRHLREGGAILIFPSGRVDPDPAVLPGAEEALADWSPSTGLVLRTVPETRVLMGIVSGVLSSVHLRNPIARLRKGIRERQLLAEFVQVIRQMILGGGDMLTARLTLSPPLAIDELGLPGVGAKELTQALVQKAQILLREHLAAGALVPARTRSE